MSDNKICLTFRYEDTNVEKTFVTKRNFTSKTDAKAWGEKMWKKGKSKGQICGRLYILNSHEGVWELMEIYAT